MIRKENNGRNGEAQKVSVSHSIEAIFRQYVPMWMNNNLGERNHTHNSLCQSNMCLAIITKKKAMIDIQKTRRKEGLKRKKDEKRKKKKKKNK